MLFWRWAIAADAGPALEQHWVSVARFAGTPWPLYVSDVARVPSGQNWPYLRVEVPITPDARITTGAQPKIP